MEGITKKIIDYKSLKKTIKELEENLKTVEGEIKAYMGDLEEIYVEGHTVRWKNVSQNRFNTKEFRSRHEALYEQFLVKSESRRFTIT